MSDNIDEVDLKILEAIAELKVSYPNADKIKAVVRIEPEELGARLGGLESEGLVKALKGAHMPGVSLPNGTYAAGLTDMGRLRLIKSK